MSFHEGGREQAVESRERRGKPDPVEGAFPEFGFCVLNADTAGPIYRTMREGVVVGAIFFVSNH